ncbi:MAG: TetR/AcrR family transcriptional regulator [Herpetosiphonaceae bacterium]|nr:TetR/AcrR family transcriptional regulator [Herpetosiphonaceae bacterium]
MKTAELQSLPRHSAEERRRAILDAAISEFATYGLHGSSTEKIAQRVGISQPYIFRLFGTKKELFLAALELVNDRILTTFMDAAAAADGHVLGAMGRSYETLLTNRDELFLLLQAFAASAEPDVQTAARARYAELYRAVAQVSGATKETLREFFAYGMLCTVAMAIDLPELLNGGQEKFCEPATSDTKQIDSLSSL